MYVHTSFCQFFAICIFVKRKQELRDSISFLYLLEIQIETRNISLTET